MRKHEYQLNEIVRSTPWLVEALEAVRDAGPPDAYIAAGAVRDTVWSWLTHRHVAAPVGDVDVVYFNPNEPSDYSNQHEAALSRHLRAFRWELTNQAWVHNWYNDADGRERQPYRSLAEGVSTWPETATAVAIRLRRDGSVDVVAPLGLDDLFGLIVRHNAVRATAAVYESRIAAKQWARRWPELRVLPSGSTV